VSGDWSKIENTMPWKFELIEMADILNKDRQTMVGIFVEYIVWVNCYCETESFPISVLSSIDNQLNCPGFCDALEQVGWIKKSKNEIKIINYDRHNGNTAKSRANTNRRVAKRRKNKNEKQ
jgi:hypothetical protein